MPTSVTPPDVAAGFPAPAPGRPALDLLDRDELARARMFALLAVVIPTSLLLLLPFLGGSVRAREILAASLAVAVGVSSWLLWSLQKDERYDSGRLLVAGAAWLAAELAALHYFGPLSPIAVALPLGVFFFGVTRDGRAQTLAYAAASGSYFVLAVSSIRAGAVDASLGLGTPLTPAQSMTLVAVAELVLFVTFLSARAVRATTVLALARAERAAWAVVQKEALLVELQKDLARALDVAGVGRFSETVVGSYRLGGVIGRGAMGEVYAAVHTATQEEAAVKLLHTHTLREAGSVQRFLREANMAQALDTPHAVRILDVGGEGGDLPYIAMERLRGEDLAEILRRSPTLSFAEILRLLEEIGAGLAAARKAGVVHRDIKPRNLFLCQPPEDDTVAVSPSCGPRRGGAADVPSRRGPEGAPITVWKLLDFGVSKFATADATHGDGRIIGTPEYMAPEQAAGEAVTHKTDLFSLAAVVYRAITGNQAFVGDHIAEVLYQVVHAMPPKPSDLVDVPPEVDLVLAVALAKTPDARFDSAEEMRDALVAATRGAITPELRARAARVLAATPWGEPPVAEEY